MSIKPIDLHLTYANTVKESRSQQLDLNRAKEFHQIAQHQQQVENNRTRQRINTSEESKGKTINNQEEKHQQSRGREFNDREKKASSGDTEERIAPKNADFKGLKIDIMI